MKTFCTQMLVIGIFLYLLSLPFRQKDTEDFSGTWKTDETKTVTIKKTQAGFVGEVNMGDKKATILDNVTFNMGKWTGVLINPSDGNQANCELVMEGEKLTIVAAKDNMFLKLIWSKR